MSGALTKVGSIIRSTLYNGVWIPSVATALFGVAPPYVTSWVVWRGLTAFLPRWIYQLGDDFLYYLYQNAVLFFFEYLSGVQVRNGRTAERGKSGTLS
jgi:hypothetical protein